MRFRILRPPITGELHRKIEQPSLTELGGRARNSIITFTKEIEKPSAVEYKRANYSEKINIRYRSGVRS